MMRLTKRLKSSKLHHSLPLSLISTVLIRLLKEKRKLSQIYSFLAEIDMICLPCLTRVNDLGMLRIHNSIPFAPFQSIKQRDYCVSVSSKK